MIDRRTLKEVKEQEPHTHYVADDEYRPKDAARRGVNGEYAEVKKQDRRANSYLAPVVEDVIDV